MMGREPSTRTETRGKQDADERVNRRRQSDDDDDDDIAGGHGLCARDDGDFDDIRGINSGGDRWNASSRGGMSRPTNDATCECGMWTQGRSSWTREDGCRGGGWTGWTGCGRRRHRKRDRGVDGGGDVGVLR